MNTLTKLTKKIAIYGIIVLAGAILVIKKLLPRKTNKAFYDKTKKKTVRKFRLFFYNLNNKFEIKKVIYKDGQIERPLNDKYEKMKNYVEKIANEHKKTSETPNNCGALNPKKDEIFYYLLNNISNMLIQNSKK